MDSELVMGLGGLVCGGVVTSIIALIIGGIKMKHSSAKSMNKKTVQMIDDACQRLQDLIASLNPRNLDLNLLALELSSKTAAVTSLLEVHYEELDTYYCKYTERVLADYRRILQEIEQFSSTLIHFGAPLELHTTPAAPRVESAAHFVDGHIAPHPLETAPTNTASQDISISQSAESEQQPFEPLDPALPQVGIESRSVSHSALSALEIEVTPRTDAPGLQQSEAAIFENSTNDAHRAEPSFATQPQVVEPSEPSFDNAVASETMLQSPSFEDAAASQSQQSADEEAIDLFEAALSGEHNEVPTFTLSPTDFSAPAQREDDTIFTPVDQDTADNDDAIIQRILSSQDERITELPQESEEPSPIAPAFAQTLESPQQNQLNSELPSFDNESDSSSAATFMFSGTDQGHYEPAAGMYDTDIADFSEINTLQPPTQQEPEQIVAAELVEEPPQFELSVSNTEPEQEPGSESDDELISGDDVVKKIDSFFKFT